MTDDKLFHVLVSRLQSRESVSLAIATITSSASLILIALFFNVKQDYPILAIILGILFPLMGLIYIEISYRGIHRHDHWWIRKIVSENNDSDKDTEKILRYEKNRKPRIILIRLILALPIFGWYFIIDFISQSNLIVGISVTGISVIIIILLYRTDKISNLDECIDTERKK